MKGLGGGQRAEGRGERRHACRMRQGSQAVIHLRSTNPLHKLLLSKLEPAPSAHAVQDLP